MSLRVVVRPGSLCNVFFDPFWGPPFDLCPMKFADNFGGGETGSINNLIVNLARKLEMIIKWLKDSGLKVN